MKSTILVLSMLCSLIVMGQSEGDKVLGKWLTGDKKAHIELYKCQDKYCGKIVWLIEPNAENGKPKVDEHNTDDKLKIRPLMGLNLLTDFVYDEGGEYEDGEIYNSRDGKIYSCNMDLKGDVLEVRGYVGISLLGKTETWTRVK